MTAEDELALPQVPEAKPEDPEDVSWALSTAEAMWARGDHLEGIKWVRKAAEAASEVEDDMRALELAKAASELTTLIARRSRASIGEGPGTAGGAPPEYTAPPPTSTKPPSIQAPRSGQPISVPPTTSRMGNAPSLPSERPAPPPVSQSKPPPIGRSASPRSVPPGPIPLPSRASVPPKASAAPAARAAPRPLATSDARQGPQAGRGILSNRTAPEAPAKNAGSVPARGRRRSRDNLDAEAKAAGVLETAPQNAVDATTADRTIDQNLNATTEVGVVEMPTANARARRRSRPEPDPTVVANLSDLVAREKSAEEWDASPTQNLTGDEMNQNMNQGDRQTAFAVPAAAPVAAPVVHAPVRGPASTVHDPEIQTSQAVRVVVWRDGNGVHVAPAGTVVSSITIDAVLVVLEPSADLTAWLSQRER